MSDSSIQTIEGDCSDCAESCPPCYIGIGELSRIAGVSPQRLNKWIRQGHIPFVRVGNGHRMFNRAEAKNAVDALFENNKHNVED